MSYLHSSTWCRVLAELVPDIMERVSETPLALDAFDSWNGLISLPIFAKMLSFYLASPKCALGLLGDSNTSVGDLNGPNDVAALSWGFLIAGGCSGSNGVRGCLVVTTFKSNSSSFGALSRILL